MKQYAKILVAVIFFFGLGVAAQAQTQDELVVKLPFRFLVGGKTLPAGTYKVSRTSDDALAPLMLTSSDNGASVFVLPRSIDNPSSYKPQLDFRRVGEQYLLSSIQTADLVYNFPLSRSLAMVAAESHDTVSTSGSGGSK